MKHNIYIHKRRWKWLLFLSGTLIFAVSIWFSNILVTRLANDERNKVKIWADAIHQKASLVNYTEDFFQKIQIEERKRVELWAEAYRRLVFAGLNEDVTFYLKIIEENTNIPVILTDEKNNIKMTANINIPKDSAKVLSGKLLEEFSTFEPIKAKYLSMINDKIYYKESKLFTELRGVLNNLVRSFFTEVVINSASVPVIVTDSTQKKLLAYGNIDTTQIHNKAYVETMINEMSHQNQPLEIDLSGIGKSLIYYKDSYLLQQLRYFPYLQFFIISIFLGIAYLLFSFARKSEQNQVWVGLAKETAHQIGTPLSSMIAWVEILKMKGVDEETITEINKDVKRLENVTDRFSKIGSPPKLDKINIVPIVYEVVSYIKKRSSSKVIFHLNFSQGEIIEAPINKNLFEWVIENLLKNAIDAFTGSGSITIDILNEAKHIHIDISDSGKGIPKAMFKTIFRPGYTSKTRGWGLGLSLSKRIIEEYHRGKIFVKSSVLNKGSVFRITIKKKSI